MADNIDWKGLKVEHTNRSQLTSWALHKQPGDVTRSDFIDPSAYDRADVVVHHDNRVQRILKQPGSVLMRGFGVGDFEPPDSILKMVLISVLAATIVCGTP